MSGKRKTARVVLRLDAAGAPAPALRAIARLARAMGAEFAARLVQDNRLAAALAFGAADAATAASPDVRRIERNLRRQIAAVAAEAETPWSFDVAQCAGVFAAECALHEDDLLAIALPEIEQMMGILREEISSALARTSGILLMTRTPPRDNSPVVGLVVDAVGLAQIVETSAELAERLRQPLSFIVADDGDLLARVRAAAAGLWSGPGTVALHAVPTAQLDILAAYVRTLRPRLVVLAPRTASIEEFLARPRLLREMGAPLLFLRLRASAV